MGRGRKGWGARPDHLGWHGTGGTSISFRFPPSRFYSPMAIRVTNILCLWASTVHPPLHVGTHRVCVQSRYLPLASLHLKISVSVGTRPRFANSILASFRTAASSILWRVSNLRRAWSADMVNPKTAAIVTRKTLRGNLWLLNRVSAKGEDDESCGGEGCRWHDHGEGR